MTSGKGPKPHYLELLNSVARAEEVAGVLLSAWAEETTDPELRERLSLVAARETSHYHVFSRRIQELGYSLNTSEEPLVAQLLEINGCGMGDIEKMRRLKVWEQGRQSPTLDERYVAAISDETVDPLTRSLLRWFTDEEADSTQSLTEVYGRMEEQSG